MWITDLIIEKQRLKFKKQNTEILPKPERKSALKYLDIERMLKRAQERQIKERK